MAFANLRRLEHLPVNQNSTGPAFTQLPTSILDALIPGYSVISKYLLEIFGFDISIIVSIVVLTVGITTGLGYLYRHVWGSFLTYFTASVVIEPYDVIYDNLMYWTQEQEDLKRVRSLKVQSADYTDDIDDLKVSENAHDGAIFNFNNWTAKIAPRYEPDTGYHWFRHKGHWFKFSRERHQVPRGFMGMMMTEELFVRLTVLGRSTKPIKDLILETRDRQLSKQTARTTVRRPSPKEQRGRGRQAWIRVAVRPSRPMTTVVLESKQKAAMLRDINDFLDPATCRWYANRGLAYRRGYLLSGPPGTGKTSLSFALAGVFGLDIYCMSLSEKTLSEEDLILLFNSLPKRCIVLLEDIDSAGVVRKKVEKNDEKKDKEKKEEKKEAADDSKEGEKTEITKSFIEQTVTKAIKDAKSSMSSSSERSSSSTDTGITMSGLLNAIDGVASQEGRVLIMTTNHPDRLDEALIRPGRVDMKIEFGLATREQIRELFLRMYCVDSREAARQPTNLKQIMPNVMDVGHTASLPAILESTGKQSSDVINRLKPTVKGLISPPLTPTQLEPSRGSSRSSFNLAEKPDLDGKPPRELTAMADTFASLLPGAVFSPAEVQGFLIMRKKDPNSAIAEVEAWRDAELGKKEDKTAKDDKTTETKKTEKGEQSEKASESSATSSSEPSRNAGSVGPPKIGGGTDTADRGDEHAHNPENRGGIVNVTDSSQSSVPAEPEYSKSTGSAALLGPAGQISMDSDEDSSPGSDSRSASEAGSQASSDSEGGGESDSDDDDDE